MGDGGESEVLGVAGMLFPPEIEEAAVAEGQIQIGADTETLGDAVNPLIRAFEFGEVADGGLIDDAMAVAVFPLRAPLFITEGSYQAKGEEDVFKRAAVGNFGLGFNAMLVAVFAGAVTRQALVGQGPAAGVVANTQDFSAGAHLAVGCVIQDVALEAAGGLQAETGGFQAFLEFQEIGDTEFDLSFQGHGQCEYTGLWERLAVQVTIGV
jgi:hypothetical protein